MTTPPVAQTSPLFSMRITSGALISALVIFAVMLILVLGLDAPPVWSLGVGPLLAVAGFAAANAVGYRIPAAGHGHSREIGLTSVDRFRSSLFTRFALAEAPMILALMLSFVIRPESAWPYLAALPFGLASLWWHIWPSEQLISRVQDKLERDGAPSYLREALGAPQTPNS